MSNIRIGLSVCVAGVATTDKTGHYYSRKVWHCPVLVKVGYVRRPKIDVNLVQAPRASAKFQWVKQGKLILAHN